MRVFPSRHSTESSRPSNWPVQATEIPEEPLFIDTWHVYGHLKRELARWHSSVRKYIALHDTEIDGLRGETLRNKWNPTQQSFETGIPVDEITKGLQPAIAEFLADHPEWTMLAHYRNNNGLTILARVRVEER